MVCTIDPYAHYTHWKQTVFYMDDFITVKKGEEVNGAFHLKPNQRNIVRIRFLVCTNSSHVNYVIELLLFLAIVSWVMFALGIDGFSSQVLSQLLLVISINCCQYCLYFSIVNIFCFVLYCHDQHIHGTVLWGPTCVVLINI